MKMKSLENTQIPPGSNQRLAFYRLTPTYTHSRGVRTKHWAALRQNRTACQTPWKGLCLLTKPSADPWLAHRQSPPPGWLACSAWNLPQSWPGASHPCRLCPPPSGPPVASSVPPRNPECPVQRLWSTASKAWHTAVYWPNPISVEPPSY